MGRWYVFFTHSVTLLSGLAISAAQPQTTTPSPPLALPSAIVSQPYRLPLSMQLNGTFPWTFSMQGPTWLAIDPATAVLAGTPPAADASGTAVTVTATDSSSPSKSVTLNFNLKVLATQPAFVVAAPADPPKPKPAVVLSRTVEGVTSIMGRAAPSSGTNTVTILLKGDGQPLDLQSGGTTTTTDSTGLFTAQLAFPLYEGEKLDVEQFREGDPLGKPTELTVQGLANWGRVKAYFAAGTVLARDSDFRSTSDLFLAFNLDKNWVWAGPSTGPGLAGRFMWNTFFEARLTSVPEANQQAGSTVPAAKPQPAAAVTNTDQLAAFIASRKAALLQAGNYFPIIATNWKYQNAPNALFIAPLAKIGFITPTGPSTSQTVNGMQTTPVNPEQFYTYYGFGGRIGHFKMSGTRDSAPELLSYLDVVMGRFSNLETLSPIFDDRGTVVLTYPRRQYRIAVEGLLKIPSTPLVLGFSANLGQNLLLEKRVQAAKDDLRFFFGTRFDVGRLFGQLQLFK